MKKLITLTAAMICLFYGVSAQDFEEVYLAYDPDSALFDNFGFSVAISGNYAVIGAPFESEDVTGENTMLYAGSAFIYERDDNGTWNFVQKIVASDRTDTTAFGFSLSISQNYIVLGAPYNDTDISGENYMPSAGSAYIFKRNAYGTWEEIQKIVAWDRSSEDHFGYSVSISENFAIIGAYQEDEDSLGSNTISNAGSVYIFQCDESGSWNEKQKIVSSDRQEGDYFGKAVSISYPYFIVGAASEDEDINGENTLENSGSAYIFELEGNRWNEVQKITSTVRGNYDYFGQSVSVSGKFAIIGARLDSEDADEANYKKWAGSAYIFERGSTGIWNLAKKIVASDRSEEDEFGISVSISGNDAIVGAHYEDEDVLGNNTIEDAGSAYIFHRNGTGNWVEIQKIVASDRGFIDYAGCSVNISGDYVMLGRGADHLHWAGAANIYESCTPEVDPDPDNIIENGNFEACILSPWSLYHSDYLGVTANAVLFDGKCTISGISLSASPENSNVQLNQDFSSTQIDMLEVDSAYVLTFDAFAESDDRHCRISIEQSIDPWTNIMNELIVLSSTTESYSFEFVMSAIYSDMQLSLQAGLENSSVTFDNVRLVKKIGGSTTALDQVNGNNLCIYPNPTSEYLTVIAENGATVKLYNSVGFLVKTMTVENNQVHFTVAGLPAGIYIVEKIHLEKHSVNRVLIQ